jgi:tetratricopeptide (TPR) repeat protein
VDKPSPLERLDGWKEIAVYLRRDVRTVQRWHKNQGLPVHRRPGERRDAPYAFRGELDAWSAPHACTKIAPSTGASPGFAQIAWTAIVAAVLAGVGTGFMLWGRSPQPAQWPTLLLVVDGQTALSGGSDRFAAVAADRLRRVGRLLPDSRVAEIKQLMRLAVSSRVTEQQAVDVAIRDGTVDAVISVTPTGSARDDLWSVRAINPWSPATGGGVEQVSDRNVADVLDQAVQAVKRVVNAPALARGELEPVTTSSLSALRLYTDADRMIRVNDFAPARPLLQQALLSDPQFASAYNLLARSLFNMDEPADRYLASSQRAMELRNSASVPEQLFIEATAHDLRGERSESEPLYMALLQIDPNHWWANTTLGNGIMRARMDDAAPFIIKAAQHLSAGPDVLARAAWVLEMSKNHAGAVAFRNRAALLLRPDTPPLTRAWVTLKPAFDQWLAGDTSSVVRQVSDFAAQLDGAETTNDLELNLLGSFYFAIGRLQQADAFLQRMTSPRQNRNPMRALVAFAAGNMTVAREYMKPFAELGHFGSNSAMWLVWLGMTNEARQAAAQLSKLKGGRTDAYGVQAELEKMDGRIDEAVALLRKTMEAGRFAPETTYYMAAESLADILKEGNRSEAIGVLEEAATNGFRAYSYSGIGVTSAYFWLRDKVRLAELYRAEGRTTDAHRVEQEVHQLLSAADPGYPLLREIANP